SYATGDPRGTAVVSVMVLVSVVMRFLQEFRSSRAAEALRAMVRTTATVTRRYAHDANTELVVSDKREVPFEDLVPGDLVHLSAGDMIPADIGLVGSKDLFVSQSALTGEAMPVEKYDTLAGVVEKSADETSTASANALDHNNLCFMGTTVISGAGTAVVKTASCWKSTGTYAVKSASPCWSTRTSIATTRPGSRTCSIGPSLSTSSWN